MGNWKIEIEGCGCHHNKRPDIDADHTAREFVKALRKQGHNITRASFTLVSSPSDDINVGADELKSSDCTPQSD